eukprot:1767810-Rhodomonas_salina.1
MRRLHWQRCNPSTPGKPKPAGREVVFEGMEATVPAEELLGIEANFAAKPARRPGSAGAGRRRPEDERLGSTRRPKTVCARA